MIPKIEEGRKTVVPEERTPELVTGSAPRVVSELIDEQATVKAFDEIAGSNGWIPAAWCTCHNNQHTDKCKDAECYPRNSRHHSDSHTDKKFDCLCK